MSQSSVHTAHCSSIMSVNERTTSQLTTRTSIAPSFEGNAQPQSRYPPGIRETIANSSSRSDVGSRSAVSEDSSRSCSSIDIEQDSTLGPFEEFSLQFTAHKGSEEPSNSTQPDPDESIVGWDILDPNGCVCSRETGIRLIENVSVNLGQIRDGMYETIKEYFPRRMSIHLWEVKSFKHLRRSLNHFVQTLEHLGQSLGSHSCFPDDMSIKVFLYAIKSSLNSVVSEGFCILKAWNRRDIGQKSGTPLQGKEWRLRANFIHGDDARLANMTLMIKQVEATVLQELKQRQPGLQLTAKSGKGLAWLKYLRPLCPVLGDCEHREHQVDQIMAGHDPCNIGNVDSA